MKKIAICSILLICSFVALSQEGQINNLVSFSLPNNVEAPTVETLNSFLKARNKTRFTTENFPGNIYKIENILLSIKAEKGITATNYLAKQKFAFDSSYGRPGVWKNYTSEIRANRNYEALIRKHDLEDYSYYYFVAVDVAHTKALSGGIEYKKEDEAKAKMLMEQLLKGLKFK